jgi:hypothetical protein
LFLSSDQLGDLSGGDAAEEGNKSLVWIEEGEMEKVTKDKRAKRERRHV